MWKYFWGILVADWWDAAKSGKERYEGVAAIVLAALVWFEKARCWLESHIVLTSIPVWWSAIPIGAFTVWAALKSGYKRHTEHQQLIRDLETKIQELGGSATAHARGIENLRKMAGSLVDRINKITIPTKLGTVEQRRDALSPLVKEQKAAIRAFRKAKDDGILRADIPLSRDLPETNAWEVLAKWAPSYFPEIPTIVEMCHPVKEIPGVGTVIALDTPEGTRDLFRHAVMLIEAIVRDGVTLPSGGAAIVKKQ